MTSTFRPLFPSMSLLVVMGVVAGVLARNYDATRERLARDELRAGAAAANSHPEDAVEHYRAALALDRENPVIRRALAVQLFQMDRPDEAESHLIELLQADPIDAQANLLRARIAAKRQAVADAETFYQRAIYGRWSDGVAETQRIGARFELIDLLSRIGSRMQARAELLRLEAESPDEPALQQDVARRFMALGDPTQAAEVLQRLSKEHPTDANAARRLTDALLTLGRFRDAREAASRALALDPRDRAARTRVEQINEALALDPTLRGLLPPARLRRSSELLARVLQDVDGCVGALPAERQTDWSALRARATSAIAAKPTSPRETDALDALSDQRLAVVDELWRLRLATCGGSDGPVAWVTEHLAR